MSIKSFLFACCPSLLRPALNRIENSPIGYRLAKGVIWSMAGAVISRGLMLVALVLVARLLGKTGYGELGMIRSTVGTFGILAQFGLGVTATKHVAEFCQNDPDRAGRIIGLSGLVAMVTGGLMALALFIFAPLLAEHIINAPQLTGSVRIGALMLFINSLTAAQTGALAGFEAFRTIAYVNVFIGLISFPTLVGGAYFGGLHGAVWALAINFGVNWLLNHLALRKESRRYRVPFTFKNCTLEWSVLWTFSLPALLSSLLAEPARWACNAMLVNEPEGYSNMGIFTAAITVQGLLLFLGAMLNAPLLSMISNAKSEKNNTLGIVNILASWFLGVLVAIPLLCFSEIPEIIFGGDYYGYRFRATFAIVIFYTCIMMFKQGLTRILTANNLLWWGVLSNTLWGIILISSTIFLVRWGALGLAASFCIAYILQTLIVLPLLYARRLIPTKPLFSSDSFVIWFVLAGLVFMNIADVPFLFRSIAFAPCLLFVGIAFRKSVREPLL